MDAKNHIEKAKTALAAANTNLSTPSDGSIETAQAAALIGIGHALIAIADEIRRSG